MHLLQTPMNPYNLQQSFYPVGDTIALAIYLLFMNIKVYSDKYIEIHNILDRNYLN